MWPTRTDERLRTGVFPRIIEQLHILFEFDRGLKHVEAQTQASSYREPSYRLQAVYELPRDGTTTASAFNDQKP
jgi:hypothetical protein